MSARRNISVMLGCWLMLAAPACSPNSVDQVEPSATEGTLCLQLVANSHYIHVDTRATQTLTDLTDFILTLDGGELPPPNSQGNYILPAGVYSLAANNHNAATTGAGRPYYEGSKTITVKAGTTTEVALDLGQPKNTQLRIALSTDFTANYENLSLSLTDAENHTIRISDAGTIYLMPGTAGYTLTAKAKKGTHIQDAATQGTVTLEPGTSQALTLSLHPITGLILVDTGDDYNGEFE